MPTSETLVYIGLGVAILMGALRLKTDIPKWIPDAGVVTGIILIICGLLYPFFFPKEIFRIQNQTLLSLDSRPQQGSVFYAYDERSIIPISAMLYIDLINISNANKMIMNYEFQISKSATGPWTSLCRMPDRLEMYLRNKTLTDMLRLDMVGLHKGLAKTTIQPSAVVSGWSAWVCPSVAPHCSFDQMRLKMTEVSGEEHYMPLFKGNSDPNLFEKGSMDVRPGTVDLSGKTMFVPTKCYDGEIY